MKESIGKLYTSNPDNLKYLNQKAEIWQITRSKTLLTNEVILVQGLAPSDQLYKKYINKWKNKPAEDWWHEYEEIFLKELETEEKINNLRLLYKKLCEGNNIVLLCFCKDAKYCHRRLVGEFFNQYDIKSIELNGNNLNKSKYKQLTIFDEVI